MASPLNPHIAGVKRSGGAGIHRPFKSPLRSSGTDNAIPRSLDASDALPLHKGTVDKQNSIYSQKDNAENPGIDAYANVKENSQSFVNTPKKPGVSSNFRGPFRHNIKSRPCSTPFRSPATKGQFSTPFQSPINSRPCDAPFPSPSSKGQFSTPFRSPVNSIKVPEKNLSKEEELSRLHKLEEELDEEITALRILGLKVEELQTHIKNLHEYNEVKDAAQLVLGKLAEFEGVTVKVMHDKYGVTILE